METRARLPEHASARIDIKPGRPCSSVADKSLILKMSGYPAAILYAALVLHRYTYIRWRSRKRSR